MLQLSVEREKLRIERQKLALQLRQARLERVKHRLEAKKAKYTAISIAVTAAAAGATLIAGVLSQNFQARAQFQLKAAEIVLSAQSVDQARASAAALQALFPERLPHDFSGRFPKDLPAFGPDIIQAKAEVLKLLADAPPERESKIIALWCRLYSDDRSFDCSRKQP